MTSDAAAFPSAHVQYPGVPGSSSVRAFRGSTAGSHLRSSTPAKHAREKPQLPVVRRQPCSPLRQRRPGQPGRQRYYREAPPPLGNAEGQVRWIVDRIEGHEDPPSELTSSAREARAVPSARRYRIRWLEFPPEQDTWEPRASLFREVPDVVQEYESSKSSQPVATADVNLFVANKNGEALHDGENGNCVAYRVLENEIVVAVAYRHDHGNEILSKVAKPNGRANVSPPCTECSAELRCRDWRPQRSAPLIIAIFRSYMLRSYFAIRPCSRSLNGHSVMCRLHALRVGRGVGSQE